MRSIFLFVCVLWMGILSQQAAAQTPNCGVRMPLCNSGPNKGKCATKEACMGCATGQIWCEVGANRGKCATQETCLECPAGEIKCTQGPSTGLCVKQAQGCPTCASGQIWCTNGPNRSKCVTKLTCSSCMSAGQVFCESGPNKGKCVAADACSECAAGEVKCTTGPSAGACVKQSVGCPACAAGQVLCDSGPNKGKCTSSAECRPASAEPQVRVGCQTIYDMQVKNCILAGGGKDYCTSRTDYKDSRRACDARCAAEVATCQRDVCGPRVAPCKSRAKDTCQQNAVSCTGLCAQRAPKAACEKGCFEKVPSCVQVESGQCDLEATNCARDCDNPNIHKCP